MLGGANPVFKMHFTVVLPELSIRQRPGESCGSNTGTLRSPIGKIVRPSPWSQSGEAVTDWLLLYEVFQSDSVRNQLLTHLLVVGVKN